MDLVEKGYIKVMMTNGEGEPIAADFEAMKNMKFNLSAGMPIQKKVTVEEAAAIPDAEVEAFIETETVKEEIVTGRKKGIVNIDTISEAYADGETVTLQSLIAKKILPKNIGFVKILARGVLDKALTVKANDFSIDAAKMIVIAGGSVVRLKTQR
jgi:ribosomal protein L15